MDRFEFAKGHGTGNDFVIVPDLDGLHNLSPQQVAALCDRRFGIGGDGLLRVVRTAVAGSAAGAPDADHTGEWFMDYRNADGTLAEMCGNGVRVFARYLVEARLVSSPSTTVATRAGPVLATVNGEKVTVEMPMPRRYGHSTATIGDVEVAGVMVDCGNPHLVCAVPDSATLTSLDLNAPPQVDSAQFPAGVNVELVTNQPGQAQLYPAAVELADGLDAQVRMRVHERGVGETYSCGSGACAVAAVTLDSIGLAHGAVLVEVPGGQLHLRITDRACELTGPAVLVATGQVTASLARELDRGRRVLATRAR